jgi:hypothetical protein
MAGADTIAALASNVSIEIRPIFPSPVVAAKRPRLASDSWWELSGLVAIDKLVISAEVFYRPPVKIAVGG